MSTYTVKQLHSNLSEILNRVKYCKEAVIVTRKGKPAAAFVPLERLEGYQAGLEVAGEVKNVG